MKVRGVFLAALFAASQAGAQSGPAESARAALEALEAAGTELQEAEKASDRVKALTRTVQAYEAGLAAIREGLRRAAVREASIRGVFDAESEDLAVLLGVLQSIEAAPAPLLLAHPDGPVGSARAGMMLSQLTPALRAKVDVLRKELEELNVLRALQDSAAETLEKGLAGAQAARTLLSQAVSNRTDLPRRFSADPEAMQTLINSAETLEGFATGLLSVSETEADSAIDLPDFASAKGRLELPAFGTVLRRAGEADAAGISRPGIVLATRPLTLVTTPWPATLRYRGPLLDYGNVVIVEPGEGYLLVLAGLGEVFGEVGEVLPPGAPVGLMGGEEVDSQAFLMSSATSTGAERPETLYIELRQDGTPVDPSDWFAMNED